MTKPTIALTELVEKGADADLLKQMIQFVAQRMMEFDVEGLCGAGFDVKAQTGQTAATATVIASGKPARVALTLRSPSCAKAATFLIFLSLDVLQGSDPGSLHSRRFNAFGGQPGQGHGHDRHLQEPSVTAGRRD